MTPHPVTTPILRVYRDLKARPEDWRPPFDWTYRDDGLGLCTAREIRDGSDIGMEMIDAAGQCWEVVGMNNVGVDGNLFERLFWGLFGGNSYWVEYDVIDKGRLSFDAIQDRVCAIIDANREYWRPEELLAGEEGPPPDEEDVYEALKAGVRRATTLDDLIAAVEEPDYSAIMPRAYSAHIPRADLLGPDLDARGELRAAQSRAASADAPPGGADAAEPSGSKTTSIMSGSPDGPTDGSALILKPLVRAKPGRRSCPIQWAHLKDGSEILVGSDLKGGRTGALMIDETGQSWEIVRVDKRIEGDSLARIFGTLIPLFPFYRVRYELVPRGPVSMAEIQERVCAAIDFDPSWWVYDELRRSGEDRPPLDDVTQLNQLKSGVRKARNMATLLMAFVKHDPENLWPRED
jgi:hypothetical protein